MKFVSSAVANIIPLGEMMLQEHKLICWFKVGLQGEQQEAVNEEKWGGNFPFRSEGHAKGKQRSQKRKEGKQIIIICKTLEFFIKREIVEIANAYLPTIKYVCFLKINVYVWMSVFFKRLYEC